MRVTIFGTGYVGLVTGTCLAEVGNDVVCVDVDADKIARLDRGEVPIYEPGLEPLVRANRRSGRLTFTTESTAAMTNAHATPRAAVARWLQSICSAVNRRCALSVNPRR